MIEQGTPKLIALVLIKAAADVRNGNNFRVPTSDRSVHRIEQSIIRVQPCKQSKAGHQRIRSNVALGGPLLSPSLLNKPPGKVADQEFTRVRPIASRIDMRPVHANHVDMIGINWQGFESHHAKSHACRSSCG